MSGVIVSTRCSGGPSAIEVGVMHEQRIGAVLHEQAHDRRLRETRRQPERRRADELRREIQVADDRRVGVHG